MTFYLRYFLFFAKSLTWKKISNAACLFFQYYYAILTKKSFITAYPTALSIEPVNFCNLCCPECITGAGKLNRQSGKIDLDAFKKIIDEVCKELSYLLLYFQGEPFLHPSFFDLVLHAKKKNIFVATSTNGHFLNVENCELAVHSGLDLLIISLDGTTEETYQKYRKGGSFSQVVAGIKTMVETKKRRNTRNPLIELQFIVFEHNEHEVEEFKKLAKKLGADKATIKTAQIENLRGNKEILPPSGSKYSRYEKDKTGRFHLKRKKRTHCPRQWKQAVITRNGDLAPCCFDKQAADSYGNVFENSVYEVWLGENAQLFRTKLLKNKHLPSICKNCPERM